MSTAVSAPSAIGRRDDRRELAASESVGDSPLLNHDLAPVPFGRATHGTVRASFPAVLRSIVPMTRSRVAPS
jgi:hypothetical protein